MNVDAEKGDVETSKTIDMFEDEDMRAAFENWKSKTYPLTVPLRIVALRSSVPPLWIKVRIVVFFLHYHKSLTCTRTFLFHRLYFGFSQTFIRGIVLTQLILY